MAKVTIEPVSRIVLGLVIIIIVVILVILLLVMLAAVLLRPLLDRYNRPADIKKAKELGDELASSKGKTFVAVVAHPDDAEWWAGGTLGLLASKGNKVVLVVGTSGEKGANVNGLNKIREQKQLEAAKIQGYSKVVFLRHPDRGLSEAPHLTEEIVKVFDQYKPDAVFTFDIAKEGPVYHHADHEAAGKAAWAAGPKYKKGLIYYLIHTSAPNTIVDFEPVKEKKGKALSIVTSYGQNALWMRFLRPVVRSSANRNNDQWYGGRNTFTEVGVQYGEVFRKVSS